MQIAVLTTDGFELRSAEVPVPGKGEVLVKTIGCGVCGGDLHVYRVRQDLEGGETLLGHEASGTVVDIGAGVEGFQVGDRVTAIGGAYADYFVASTDCLIRLPDTVDPLYALGEPLACCVHACDRLDIGPDDDVAIVGCGFMGLICLQLARIQGARSITAIDPVASRRTAAQELGASIGLHPADVSIDDRDEGAFDVVIEAAGVPSAIDLCTEAVRQHGKVVLVGYHESHDGLRTVDMKLWNFKAIDVINGHVRRHDEKMAAMKQGIELLSTGRIVTEPLVRLYDLESVENAFSDFAASDAGLFKAVLVPSADD